MTISLLNLGMLAGLLGIAVPVLIHLLNRRRYDVVEWGAMQFLKLGERTRQRIKLSDLLLLLLRMGLIVLLAFAFSRPFVKGSTWIRSLYPEPVDLVLIIDGSYSMGWEGEALTPHARAIQTCHEILDDLSATDRVAIIDARSRPFLLTPAPLTDVANARLELEKIQRPDGTADLVAAMKQACQLLTQSFSTRREILLLTDKQQSAWRLGEAAAWSEMLQFRHAAAVPIQLTALDVGSPLMEELENFQVERVELSRELTVVQTPITATTRVKYTGPLEETNCTLHWSIDGQRLSRESRQLTLRQGEQQVVQFTARFSDPGSHVVTASVEPDVLPGDDTAHAIVQVLPEIPVVLGVDADSIGRPIAPGGRAQLPLENYLRLAFGNPDRGQVWVRATTRGLTELDSSHLENTRLLFLLGRIPPDWDWRPITEFLLNGGAVVILSRADSTPADWAELNSWTWNGQPVPPAILGERIRIADGTDSEILDMDSLTGAWLQRFREAQNIDLADAQFRLYDRLQPLPESASQSNEEPDGGDTTADSPLADDSPRGGQAVPPARLSPPVVDARLQNGDPVFYRRFVGRGQVLMGAIPWDAEENDLVRQRSFVPFLHELVFGLTRTTSNRNVELGQPLVLSQLSCQPLSIPVVGPDDTELSAPRGSGRDRVQWILAPPRLSGIYTFRPECPANGKAGQEQELPFAVHAPREESVLTRLTEEDVDYLSRSYGVRWKSDSRAMLSDLANASAGIEMWPLLLLLVTMLLVAELLLTRHLVQGGHAEVDAPAESV